MYTTEKSERSGSIGEKKRKAGIILLFHETCRINADLGLVPLVCVSDRSVRGRGLKSFMSRPDLAVAERAKGYVRHT